MKIYEVLYDDSRTFCPTMKIARAVKRKLVGWYHVFDTVFNRDEDDYEDIERLIKPSEITIHPVEFSSDGGMKEAACRVAYLASGDESPGSPWWKLLEEGGLK